MKYEKCLECNQLGNTCDGPNFLAMDGVEIGQWCEAKRKQTPRLTYDRIAAETGLSKSAVYNFMHGKHPDYRIETVRPVVKVITGGKWDDNPCGNVSNTEKAKYEEAIRHYESEIKWRDDKIQHFLTENERLHAVNTDTNKLLRERYDFLKRKDRYIAFLTIALSLCLVVIIGALVIDWMNTDMGFFWLEETIAAFHQNQEMTTSGINSIIGTKI